jgi:hypothetical protein
MFQDRLTNVLRLLSLQQGQGRPDEAYGYIPDPGEELIRSDEVLSILVYRDNRPIKIIYPNGRVEPFAKPRALASVTASDALRGWRDAGGSSSDATGPARHWRGAARY